MIINHTYPTYERTKGDQIFLTAYVIWILLADLVGNSFVLFSTLRYKAIKMDRMSVWIIQNLSIVDLCSNITVMLPVFIANINGNRWILGQTVCNIVGYMKYFFLILSIFFLMSLSLNKLIRCLYPLRQLYYEKKTLLKLTIGLYIFTSLQTFYMLTLDELNITVVEFMPTQSYCTMVSPTDPNRMWYFEIVCHFIYNILPLLVLSFCNVSLLIFTCTKSSRQIKKSSIISVLLISFMFMSCTFFYSLSRVILHFKHSAVSGHFLTFAYFLHMNTYWLNPPIYIVTNPGFRKFVHMWWLRGFFTKITPGNSRASDADGSQNQHYRISFRHGTDTFLLSQRSCINKTFPKNFNGSTSPMASSTVTKFSLSSISEKQCREGLRSPSEVEICRLTTIPSPTPQSVTDVEV